MALKKAHKIVKETVATLPAPSLVNRRTDAEKLILARLDLVTAALPPADTDDKHDAPLACIVWFGLWTERFVTVGSVMQQAWKAQVTDSCVFSACYSWQVAGLAQ